MDIKPIRSESDYNQALHRVEELWGWPPETPEGDELDVLVPLIESYEREHYPVDIPTAIDAIKFRLDQEGKDYKSLIGIIGHRTRVYEVMRGARPLSLGMIRKLHSQLGIPADVLIQPHRSSRGQPKRTPAAYKKKSRASGRVA